MFEIQKKEANGITVYVLSGNEGSRRIEAWVAPSEGMNTTRILVDDQPVIDWDMTRFQNGGTYGIPILYPTPNRLPEGKYSFEGRDYVMALNGGPVTSHGIVRKQPFTVTDLSVEDEKASITGRMTFEPGRPVYEAFPFLSDLYVTLSVTLDSWKFEYKVVNHDQKDLPYAIALHPFFYRQGKGTVYRSDCGMIQNMCEKGDPYPTMGTSRDPKGTREDIRSWVNPDSYILPSGVCYYGCDPERSAEVYYPDSSKLHVTLSASPEFTFVVAFAPEGFPYFCLENQSGSADAINTYTRGQKDAARLNIVAPGAEKQGHVSFLFERG